MDAIRKMALLLVAATLLAGCATTPTGQHQLEFYSQSTMDQLGAKAYARERKSKPVSHNRKINQFVDCVAHDIIDVVNRRSDENYDWEVTVFKKDVANAFALPGGKIAVYTGILKYARNQAQLAAVLGHETGHVLAHHANARMTTSQLTQAGVGVAAVLLGQSTDMNQRTLLALLGAGSQVGILLPFSRSQESEADLIGLNNMARAGFDPRQAVVLWKHMNRNGQPQPPVFLSTHPGNGQRIEHLQNHMGKALYYFHQAREKGRKPECGKAPPAPSESGAGDAEGTRKDGGSS